MSKFCFMNMWCKCSQFLLQTKTVPCTMQFKTCLVLHRAWRKLYRCAASIESIWKGIPGYVDVSNSCCWLVSNERVVQQLWSCRTCWWIPLQAQLYKTFCIIWQVIRYIRHIFAVSNFEYCSYLLNWTWLNDFGPKKTLKMHMTKVI